MTYEEDPLEYQTIEAATTNRIAGYANSAMVSMRSSDPVPEPPIADWVCLRNLFRPDEDFAYGIQ